MSSNKIPLSSDLLAFAKTGAPPEQETLMFIIIDPLPKYFEHLLLAEGAVSDTASNAERKDCKEFCGEGCTCDLRLKWVDTNPTYAKTLDARDAVAAPRGAPEYTCKLDEVIVNGASFKSRSENMVTPKFKLKFKYMPGCDLPGCGTRAVCPDCADDKPKKKHGRPASLNAFAREVHQANQHWWHDPATGEKLNRNMGEMLMLVVSEIAECMEGERKNLMDDHLPHRKMAEVELADAVIRIADIVGSNPVWCSFFEERYRVVSLERSAYSLPENKGEALHMICAPLQAIRYYDGYAFVSKLARCVARIETYAKKHGYDLWGAVAEKREYNKHRADHKPAARLAKNGKAW